MLPPGAGLGLILFLAFFDFASYTALFSSPLIGFPQDMHGVTVSACALFPFVQPCSDRAAGGGNPPTRSLGCCSADCVIFRAGCPHVAVACAAGAGLGLFLVRFFVFRSVFVFGFSFSLHPFVFDFLGLSSFFWFAFVVALSPLSCPLFFLSSFWSMFLSLSRSRSFYSIPPLLPRVGSFGLSWDGFAST